MGDLDRDRIPPPGILQLLAKAVFRKAFGLGAVAVIAAASFGVLLGVALPQ